MEAAHICNDLPSPALFNGLIIFKSKKIVIKMYRTASDVSTVVSKIPNVINTGNVFIAPGKGFP